LAHALVPRGDALLARLALNGEPFAVAYGHRVRQTYHCFQRGVSLRTQPVRSPGTAVLLLVMAHLAEHGVTCYDHLMGANPFKERFSTGQQQLVRLCATWPTFRSLASLVAGWARRGARKAFGLLRQATRSPKHCQGGARVRSVASTPPGGGSGRRVPTHLGSHIPTH